jgi:hypothetical protein
MLRPAASLVMIYLWKNLKLTNEKAQMVNCKTCLAKVLFFGFNANASRERVAVCGLEQNELVGEH